MKLPRALRDVLSVLENAEGYLTADDIGAATGTSAKVAMARMHVLRVRGLGHALRSDDDETVVYASGSRDPSLYSRCSLCGKPISQNTPDGLRRFCGRGCSNGGDVGRLVPGPSYDASLVCSDFLMRGRQRGARMQAIWEAA